MCIYIYREREREVNCLLIKCPPTGMRQRENHSIKDLRELTLPFLFTVDHINQHVSSTLFV